MQVPGQPDLYRIAGDSFRLAGTRCAKCGHVAFPAMTIGCDVCGALERQLEPVDLAPVGALHSLAVVHLHQGPPPAPFAVAEVRLDDGPLIRVMVSAASGPLAVGDRVYGVLDVVGLDGDGHDVVEPAFVGGGR